MTRYQTTCTDCGYTATYKTEAVARYDRANHTCPPARLTLPDRIEELEHLTRCGVPPAEAATRAGWPSLAAASRALYRAGHPLAGALEAARKTAA